MKTATKELSEKVYKLTGWKGGHIFYQKDGTRHFNFEEPHDLPKDIIPAYNAEYLADQLPKGLVISKAKGYMALVDTIYSDIYLHLCDALADLAIKIKGKSGEDS